jgi:aromatic ring-opening dioxygenase catalytic subunit (LigB family)
VHEDVLDDLIQFFKDNVERFRTGTLGSLGNLVDKAKGYYGFPEETYNLTYPAPGSPALAEKVRKLLSVAGIEHASSSSRGFDHGTFIPLMLSYPEANVPVVQLSLREDLDPAFHLAVGQALQSLREEQVLLIGSGMSYHNLDEFFSGRQNGPAAQFDSWLTETVCQLPANERNERLKRWSSAPGARASHPREEHLIPLMVIAGAAGDDKGERCYNERLLGKANSAYKFG